MTISQRLMLLVGAAITSLLALTGINYQQMNRVFDAANYANVNVVPSIALLNDAAMNFGRERIQLFRHALALDAKEKEEAEKTILESRAKIDKALRDYEAFISNAEDKSMLEAERKAMAEYDKVADKVLELSRANRLDEVRVTLTQQVGPLAVSFNSQLEKHILYNEELGKKSAAEGAAAKESAIWTAVAILVTACIVVALLSFAIIRGITSRIAEANAVAARIASGDLSRNAGQSASHDEIGQLLGSLEAMRADLASTISGIIASSDSVAYSASQLSSTAQQVSVSTEQQSSSTAAAAAAVEELTVSIDHVGSSAEDASHRAVEAGRQAIASGTGVEAATEKIGQVSQQVENTASQIQTLSEQVQQIDKITVVIREVADQTNLLALNAAIEAARAGEHGLGFAVVADEVRKLAERSSLAAKEITQLIKESTRRVAEGAQLSEKVGHSLHAIVQAVEQTATGIATIAESTETQAESAKEVQVAIRSVGRTTESNAAGAEEMAASAEELGAQASTLRDLVARFKV